MNKRVGLNLFALLLFVAALASPALAQTEPQPYRLSDREVESIIRSSEKQVCCARLSSKPLSRRTLRNRSAGVRPVSRAGWSCHGSITLKPGENSLRLPRTEFDKIINVVKHCGCDEDQAVKTIQQSAVTGDELRGVFKT